MVIRICLALFSLALVLGCASSSTSRPPAESATVMKMRRHLSHLGRAPSSEDETQINQACKRFGWTAKVTRDQQLVINSVFAARARRLQHALWHAVRSDLNHEDARDLIQAYGSPWGDAHPLCPPPQDDARDPAYNPAGEDFFYMHHQMVLTLRHELTANGKACIAGWDRIPDTQTWPVPDPAPTGVKADLALEQLRTWDANFHSQEWLREHSLSQVGWALEFNLYDRLLLRYATARPPAPFTGSAPLPLDGRFPKTWPYDSVKYNWLADPYGAPVNPYFWKIHGYVEKVLNRWLAANGYTRAAEDCSGHKGCYEWHHPWVGEIPTLARHPRIPDRKLTPSEKDNIKSRTQAFNQSRLEVPTCD